ncbi:MAG: hypothetical protein ACOYXU_04060 [Nitrospirota bacterium]
MRDFSRRGYRIGQATGEIKVIYTGFLVFAAVGYLTLVAIALTRVGPSYQQIVEHYRGTENEDFVPRPVGQMLEEAHFHAFIQGVTLLVLTHLFVATGASRRFKRTVVVAAFAATLADLASPWLVRFAAPGFAVVQLLSWILMTGTAALLIGVPIYDMWWNVRGAAWRKQ